jgi:hypothetical protein
MNNRILNNICYFLHIPEKLLICSKQFSINRFRNIRWKNKIYFKDNRIKIKNIVIEKSENLAYGCKEIWYLNGEMHRNDIDPTTGLTLPTIIEWNESKHWYKDGEQHRDDIDLNTGMTLPSVVSSDNITIWYNCNMQFRYDFSPDNGSILPYAICKNETKLWDIDDIDHETGLTHPSIIDEKRGHQIWVKKGIPHRDEIDPDTGIYLPAKICRNGNKYWYRNGIKFIPENNFL